MIGNTYQWIKSENAGKVETVQSETTKMGFAFLNFESGNGIFVEKLTEYMTEFQGTENEINSINTSLTHSTPTAPTPTLTEAIQPSQQQHQPTVIDHPLLGLVSKLKKRKIKINLPTRTPTIGLFKNLIENFDEGDVLKVITDNIYNELIENEGEFKAIIIEELTKLYKLKS